MKPEFRCYPACLLELQLGQPYQDKSDAEYSHVKQVDFKGSDLAGQTKGYEKKKAL